MFPFWSRRNNKSPASIVPLQPSQKRQGVDLSRTSSRIAHVVAPEEDGPPETAPAEAALEPVVAAVPNPHDVVLSEVHAKLLQVEKLSSAAHLPPPTDAARPPNPSPEPLFDPATGEQRGVFEPVAGGSGGSGDSEQLRDEVWAHLAHIRQIQSEIATMHRQMEGIGDESGALDVEVDNDVDVDTVPTQEEEDAAERAKEFDRLPGKFAGRKDNIDAMMAKLNDLSQAVTSFHALQPPPLRFDSAPAPTSQEGTHSDISVPPGSRPTPVGTVRTRPGIHPTAPFGTKVIADQKPLHESPITLQDPLSPIISNKM